MATAVDTDTIPPGMEEEHPLPNNGGSCLEKDSPAAMPTAADCQPYDRMAAFERRMQDAQTLISSLSNIVSVQSNQIADLKQQVSQLNSRVEELQSQQQLAQWHDDRQQQQAGEKLLFNFENIQKKDVYWAILRIYSDKGFSCTNDELIHFLSIHTNLGSESTINNQFYNYKKQL